MRIPEPPGAAQARGANEWLARATNQQSCLGVFARFGMGFSPELIASFDPARRDDAAASASTTELQ
jgi:hypothetical protein